MPQLEIQNTYKYSMSYSQTNLERRMLLTPAWSCRVLSLGLRPSLFSLLKQPEIRPEKGRDYFSAVQFITAEPRSAADEPDKEVVQYTQQALLTCPTACHDFNQIL